MVVGVALDRAVGTGDGSALVLWLAVVAGVFVVLASCGAVGYWLMDRARLRAGRDLRVRVAARVARPGRRVAGAARRAGRPGQLRRRPEPASSSPRTPGSASALAALMAGSAVLLAASPVLALAVLTGVPVVLVVSRLLARPLVRRAEVEQIDPGRRDLGGHRPGHRAAGAQGHRRGGRGRRGYARASQTALRARLVAATAEGGYLSGTTALTGLFLVVVAWAGRPAGPGRGDQHR